MFYDGAGDSGGNVSDGQGNLYTNLKVIQSWDASVALYGSTLTSGGPLTVNSSGVHTQMVLVEFSGVSLTIDGSAQALSWRNGRCPSGTPLSVKTTASDLLVSMLVESVTNGTTTFSSGALAQGVGSQKGAFQFVYQIAPSAGTYTQQFSFSPGYNAGNQSCAMVALRATPATGNGGGSTPRITSLTPSAGAVRASIAIAGANLGASQGTSRVTFNGTAATPTSWSATGIVAPVPEGATTGNVMVTMGEAASNGSTFTVTATPSIASLTPAAGTVGGWVTIAGANFGASQGTSTVTFNGTAATPTSWSGNGIVAPVPVGATTGNVMVTVTVGGAVSNGSTFAITPLSSPAPKYVNSKNCAAASTCTTDWNVTAGDVLMVMFYDGAGDSGGNVSDGQGNLYTNLKAIESYGASLTLYGSTLISGGPLTVNSSGVHAQMVLVEFSGVSLTTDGSAQALSFRHGRCPSGTPLSVTTTASDLLVSMLAENVSNGTTTFISGARAQGVASQKGAFQFVYQIAPSAGTYTQQFSFSPAYNAGNQSCAMVALRAMPATASGRPSAPGITSLTPAAGAVGASIMIAGANFGASQGASTVTFNGRAATPASWSATGIVAPVPAGATTGDVMVTVGGAVSNGSTFTVTAAPGITGLTPAAGAVGALIMIAGANFGASQGASTVTFNGRAATPASWSATGIVAPVPAGATAGDVMVTVGGAVSNGSTFRVMGAAGVLSLTVVGTTPTQALLQYTAPSAAACTVEASESPTYLPLVHDVHAGLFPQANLDTRAGNLVSGQARVVVIGKRYSETASDQNTYSRALQANTNHYFRVNCSGVTGAATATTANIPAGATYNDGPQIDTQPGQWKMPTRFEDRNQTTIDPQTGALLHQVSLDAESYRDHNYSGMFLTYGGFNRVCDPKMVGPANGPLGFLCTFPRYGQMGNAVYWIVPSTAEVRFLGDLPILAGGPMGPLNSDLTVFGNDGKGNTLRATYVGNFQPASAAAMDYWMTYSTVPTSKLLRDFDSSFDPAVYQCPQPAAAAGQYALFACTSGGQDSPGWLGVLYGGDGRPLQPGCNAGDACPRVVAAMNVFAAAPTRYCGLHNVQQLGNMASINVQRVANQPVCAAFGKIIYWKFLNDPHGLDTTNTKVVVDQYFDGGGHWDYGPLGRLTEYGSGWAAVFGDIMNNLNRPMSLVIDDSPSFAGARGLSYGATTSKHPSYHQVAGVAPQSEMGWFMDAMSYDGGQFYSSPSGATKISGQLYRWNPGEGTSLARKQLPTLAVSGGYSLTDISGPGSVLSDSSADSYRYCVAHLAGECRGGSLPGEVYVNAPNVQYLNCLGSDGPNPQNRDICIGNLSTYSQAITQIVMGSDSADSNARSRVISHGLSGIRNSFYYWTAKSLPDASWALFTRGLVAPPFGDLLTVWMAKLPPLAAPDGIDRSTFLPVTVNLTPPANSKIARAIIQFGYAEQGDPNKYYCTSRREACVAASPAFTAANPFQYATTESHSGVPCATSCQITIPVLPLHVAYYQAVYLDASGHVVATGNVGVSGELAQASVPGVSP